MWTFIKCSSPNDYPILGNALTSYFMSEFVVMHNPHKNQVIDYQRAFHDLEIARFQHTLMTTVKSVYPAAATISFECFQGPILLSKLKKVTKDVATI